MHIVEFIGRLLLSALFLIEGFGKISMQENVITYMEDYGVPGVLFVVFLLPKLMPKTDKLSSAFSDQHQKYLR